MAVLLGKNARHNICCLIQNMYELSLKPRFWKEVALDERQRHESPPG